jgi:hypothetical protein
MVTPKYLAGNKFTIEKKGLPNAVKQKLIISYKDQGLANILVTSNIDEACSTNLLHP